MPLLHGIRRAIGARRWPARLAAAVLLATGSSAAQQAAPPWPLDRAPPPLPLATPCDLPFGGPDCLPTALLVAGGATLSEHFSGQSVGGAAGQNETLTGTPSSPLALSGVAANDGVSEYLGTVAGLAGEGCLPSSFGEGVISVLFALPQQRVVVTPEFLDGGTGSAQAYAANGTLLTGATGTGSLDLLATSTPIRGLTLVSNDPGGLGWRVYAEPWNAIVGIDPLTTANAATHHTQGFPSGLQVRRGEPAGLQVEVELAAPFDAAVNQLRFRVQHGFDGGPTDIPLDPWSLDPAAWHSELLSVSPDGLHATCRLNVPVSAPIGSYALTAEVWLLNCAGEVLVDAVPLATPLVVLFNPWASGDGAFLPGTLAGESVLSEQTVIFLGDTGAAVSWTWRYGSFGADALAALQAALAGQPSAVRADPLQVARRLAGFTEGPTGILLVQPGGPWTGGTPPFSWTGSDQVFAAYAAGGGPVAYGLDWTAAGVLASLLRTAGIGSRCISGYQTARDLDGQPGGVDVWFTTDGHVDLAASIDRMADVHVWTEAYLRRPDIPGADGWQALETHAGPGPDGQAGPAALTSILGKKATEPWDAVWFRTLVDSDLRVWRAVAGGPPLLLGTKTAEVGKKLLTKAPGVNSPLPVTFSYKPTLAPPPPALPGSGIDVNFHPPAVVVAGQPIDWKVTLDNKTPTGHLVHVVLDGHVLSADGEPLALVGSVSQDVQVDPHKTVNVSLPVPAGTYAGWLATGLRFQASAGVDVPDSGDVFADIGRTRVAPPPLTLSVTPSHSLPLGGQLMLQAGLTNPLPVALTNASVTFAAPPGLGFGGAAQKTVALGTIGAGLPALATTTLQGTAEGLHAVTVSFACDQFGGSAASSPVSVGSTWTDLGQGLAGSLGTPLLLGDGPLTPGSAGSLSLQGARPLAGGTLFLGTTAVSLPLKGGHFVPAPIVFVLIVQADASGNVALPWTAWPANVPPGTPLVFQAWLVDPTGPQGVAASNALKAVTP